MKYDSASLPELRHQLEIAQTLAKAHVSFVVMPCETREDFNDKCWRQVEQLEHLAFIVEKGSEA